MSDPEWNVSVAEAIEVAESALDDKGVIALRALVDGATISEIADEIGLSVKTTRETLDKAVRLIRAALDAQRTVDVSALALRRGADDACALFVARLHGGWRLRGRIMCSAEKRAAVDADLKSYRWRDVRHGPFLYLIRWAGTDVVKIGYTTDLRSRFEGIRGSVPFPVEALAFREGSTHDERMLHARFQPSRINGEWFKLAGDEISILLSEPGWHRWESMEGVKAEWSAAWEARCADLQDVIAREQRELDEVGPDAEQDAWPAAGRLARLIERARLRRVNTITRNHSQSPRVA